MALREASTDMISDLPKNVIDNIMKFLPLIDVARMSVLSKKWRSTWLSVPRLIFDDEFADPIQDMDYDSADGKWSSVISNILLHHEGPIIEFSLTIPFQLSSSSHIDISPWISFVSRNGVKSLTLFNDNNDEPLFRLPTYFFSFVGLENLTLDHCNIGHLPSLKGLRNLLSLTLYGVVFEAGIFQEFVACCPLLENLVLTCCSIHDPLIINMPNLKRLYVDGLFRSISFKNASSLLSVSLGLKDVDTMEGAADMMRFLASSCILQQLCLYGHACKILANNGISRILPTTFKALKILNLCCIGINHMNEFLCAFGMIRSCLNMEKLEIWMRVFTDNLNMQELKALADSETNDDLGFRFTHLHSIFIRDIRGLPLEMNLISYLLAFSPSLERLSFTCHSTLKARKELQLYRQMLQFRRASPKAEVLYVK